MKLIGAGLALCLFVMYPPSASGEIDSRQDFGFGIYNYTWKEHTDDGTRLLKEKGRLFSIYNRHERYRDVAGSRRGTLLYLGQMDYSGHTWDGRPVETDVLYLGGQFHLDLCFRGVLDPVVLKGFFGLSPCGWMRRLDDSMTADGDKVIGATEWWFNFHGRVGAGGDIDISPDTQLFMQAGVKLPLFTRNYAYYTSAINATVKPEQQASMFGDIGVRWRQLSLSIGYDSWKFNKSEPEGPLQMYQPDSKGSMFTVKLGLTQAQ